MPKEPTRLSPLTEYISVSEAAEIAGLSAQGLRSLIARRAWREGVHYTRPTGMRLRIVRRAFEEWLAGGALVPDPRERLTGQRSKLAPYLMPPGHQAMVSQFLLEKRVATRRRRVRIHNDLRGGQRMEVVHSELDREIGIAMRAERERRGLSVDDIAEGSGLPPELIACLERGGDCWSSDLLRDLAPLYGVGRVLAYITAGLITLDDLSAWRGFEARGSTSFGADDAERGG